MKSVTEGREIEFRVKSANTPLCAVVAPGRRCYWHSSAPVPPVLIAQAPVITQRDQQGSINLVHARSFIVLLGLYLTIPSYMRFLTGRVPYYRVNLPSRQLLLEVCCFS